MHFNHFLSAYLPDTAYGGARLFGDMLEQARLADEIGYASVCIPEHHLINNFFNAISVANGGESGGGNPVCSDYDFRCRATPTRHADFCRRGCTSGYPL
ncbi:MAG: hypothetical protein R1F54_06855 [Candidatus Zeuxoniibacter abyssi]|nr:MAG: hypothetical protein R1F54_06855 [Candidatus Persebacteraceae bacterium AB1(2)]